MKTIFVWHFHHKGLVEPLVGGLAAIRYRQGGIRRNKPKGEQETRLTLFKVVQGKLPLALVKAGTAYDKARAVCAQAGAVCHQTGAVYAPARAVCAQDRDDCVQARAAYAQALKAHLPEIEALHAKECPNCPWDGSSIFPK